MTEISKIGRVVTMRVDGKLMMQKKLTNTKDAKVFCEKLKIKYKEAK